MLKDEIDFAHVLKTRSKMFFRKTSYQCFPSDNQLKLGQHRLLDITAAQNKKFPGSRFFGFIPKDISSDNKLKLGQHRLLDITAKQSKKILFQFFSPKRCLIRQST